MNRIKNAWRWLLAAVGTVLFFFDRLEARFRCAEQKASTLRRDMSLRLDIRYGLIHVSHGDHLCRAFDEWRVRSFQESIRPPLNL